MAALKRIPVVVLGATGTGKSKLAIELGKHFNSEIINADSMQLYQGLDIITNKVSPNEQAMVPHHMLSIFSPLSLNNTVVNFRNKALPILERLLDEGKVPIIVGGTNYYIEALLWESLIDNQVAVEFEAGFQDIVFLPSQLVVSTHFNDCYKDEHLTALPKLFNEVIFDTHVAVEFEAGFQDIVFLPSQLVVSTHFNDCYKDEAAELAIKLEETQMLLERHQAEHQALEPSIQRAENSPGAIKSVNCDGSMLVAPTLAFLESDISDGVSASQQQPVGDVDRRGKHPVSWARQEKEGKYADSETSLLYECLTKVDGVSARACHPENRRKIVRALQVYDEYKLPMSQILRAQHLQGNNPNLSGPLRYPRCCVFWIQTDQSVLEDRLNDRVKTMLDNGLMAELNALHCEYLESVLSRNGEPDYTIGIFQTIGFKEFHDYLVLPRDQQDTPEALSPFNKGLEDLRIASRQYSRTQIKRIRSRFVNRPGSHPLPVFALDSTDPTHWKDKVLQPATEILSAFLDGREIAYSPLPRNPLAPEVYIHKVCRVCNNRVFNTQKQWEEHITSNKHHRVLTRRRRQERAAAADVPRTQRLPHQPLSSSQ